ncbi:MAG: pentapeptide repeat-containing protein [Planktothrix sp.]
MREANLSGADLREADLSRTKLENAIVLKARFGQNKGIDEALKADLIKRGAIF